MTVERRTPYRNTVQNSQLRRKVTTLHTMHCAPSVCKRPDICQAVKMDQRFFASHSLCTLLTHSNLPYSTDFISPRKNIVFCPAGWLRARKISIYFGGAELKTGIFGVFWSLSGKKPCAGLVYILYFQGAGLMRECETKIFFWGCGLNPSLYGTIKIPALFSCRTSWCRKTRRGRSPIKNK